MSQSAALCAQDSWFEAAEGSTFDYELPVTQIIPPSSQHDSALAGGMPGRAIRTAAQNMKPAANTTGLLDKAAYPDIITATANGELIEDVRVPLK